MKIFLFCYFQLFAPLLFSQVNYTATIDHYMHAAANINGFNGTVLVAKRGQVIYHKSFGYKDPEGRQILNNSSQYELGSMTFGFTAEAILILQQQGKLALTDDIRKYFPELPYDGITIARLLSCSTGLPDYFFVLPPWDSSRLATNTDVVNALAQKKTPLRYQPGTKWDWDITAYALLSSVIEKASGLSYAAFLRRYIFEPLDMRYTRIYSGFPYAKAADTSFALAIYSDYLNATGIDTTKEPLQMWYALSYGITGDAGINTTAADLYKWDRALKGNLLLPAAVQANMFAPKILMDSTIDMHFGYGFRTGKNELGSYLLQQEPGAQRVGFGADMTRYIDDDISIIVLTNKSKEFTCSKVAGALAYIMYDKEVVLPYVHKRADIAPEILHKYAGKYALPTQVEFVVRDGKLVRLMANEPDEELIPESPTKFFIDPVKTDFQIEFETDQNGNPVKAYLIASGLKKEIRKL